LTAIGGIGGELRAPRTVLHDPQRTDSVKPLSRGKTDIIYTKRSKSVACRQYNLLYSLPLS